jgi:putative flavoprotein involved in K+ transport
LADGETRPDELNADCFEVAAVGAGQAGLAIGYFLARQGRRFVILERAGSIAAAWRERWESLTLFTPRRYTACRGFHFRVARTATRHEMR